MWNKITWRMRNNLLHVPMQPSMIWPTLCSLASPITSYTFLLQLNFLHINHIISLLCASQVFTVFQESFLKSMLTIQPLVYISVTSLWFPKVWTRHKLCDYKQEKSILSQFWRAEVQNQGVGRAVHPPKSLTRWGGTLPHLLQLLTVAGPQCSFVLPASFMWCSLCGSAFTWPSSDKDALD